MKKFTYRDRIKKLRLIKESLTKKKQTNKSCLAAVKQHGRALIFVKKQTPEICLAAVKQDGYALQFVKEQTPEICLAAVKQNGWALMFVHEQNKEICHAAIDNDIAVLRFATYCYRRVRYKCMGGLDINVWEG